MRARINDSIEDFAMPPKHTAILYVHGIGSPARNSSLSNFLDYFDLYGQTQSKDGIGKPRDFSYKTAITSEDQVIHYVEFKRVVEVKKSPRVAKTIRVYEAYWVPEAESRYSIFYIFFWLLMRALNPFRLAFSSWRNFPSFRLSVRSKKERVISAGYDSVGFLRFDGDHDGLDRNHSPAL